MCKNKIDDIVQKEKKLVGERATDFIKDGMILGLGTGSTVYYTILKVGKMVQEGLKIQAVSTSNSTTTLAKSLGIPIVSLNDVSSIDLTIDGADEVDPNLNGIKGGGGALLFEKIVAHNSKQNIWVVDSKKIVEKLGAFRLPVEVIPCGVMPILRALEKEGYDCRIRMKADKQYYTDSGNLIIDTNIMSVQNYQEFNQWLINMPGVVETGLFLDVVDKVIVPVDNEIKIITRDIEF